MRRIGNLSLALVLVSVLGACEGITGPGAQVGPFRTTVTATPARISPRDSVLIRVVLRNVEATPYTFADDIGFPTCSILLTIQSRSAASASTLTPCTGVGATMQRPPLTIAEHDSAVGTVWWPGADALAGGALPAGTYDVAAAIWWSHFQISHRVAVTEFVVGP